MVSEVWRGPSDYSERGTNARRSLRRDDRRHAEPHDELRDEIVARGGERSRAAGGIRGARGCARNERALAEHFAVEHQRRARGERAVAFRFAVEDLLELLEIDLQ